MLPLHNVWLKSKVINSQQNILLIHKKAIAYHKINIGLASRRVVAREVAESELKE